jgi:hypothetical protein
VVAVVVVVQAFKLAWQPVVVLVECVVELALLLRLVQLTRLP